MHAAEFEDALGTSVSEDASDSTDGRQVSTKYIDVPGAGKVHIGKAINMAMQGFGQNETAIVPGKLEPGRVARTRDQVKAGTSNTRVPDDVPASGVVAHEDPVLFLVIKRGVLVPCVVSCLVFIVFFLCFVWRLYFLNFMLYYVSYFLLPRTSWI